MGITKKKITVVSYIEVFVLVALATFIIATVWYVHLLQGTARIVNYAGIARGATQRLVKLEIVGNSNQELEDRLDVILEELKNGGDVNNLIKLNDDNYQKCLDEQIAYWDELKAEIEDTRENGYENTNILEASEEYFTLADTTVSAAESYSNSLTSIVTICEYGMTAILIILIIMFCWTYSSSLKLARNREEYVRNLAEHDEITGLLNRRSFERLLDYYESGKEPFALHIVDIDYFKQFNDNYGHAMGDQVLVRVARALEKAFRSGDHICRIGGDEFAVIMTGMNRDLSYVTEGKLNDLKDMLNHEENGIPGITLSVGVAFSKEVPDKVGVFKAADGALYEVKENGRNGYGFYE